MSGDPGGLLRGDAPFVVLAIFAGVVLVYLGRSLTFYNDEWRWIDFRGGLVDYLRPHAEHWSTIPLLVYRGTFHVVGLSSYFPYLIVLIALHVAAVAGAYVLMRFRLIAPLATLLAIPLLFRGVGGENLFWAFQTGFVGSVAFGVWALVVVEREWRWATLTASLLLLASLMASGIGLFFVVAMATRTALDLELRARAVSVIAPLTALAIWYVSVGYQVDPTYRPPRAGPLEALSFMVRGVARVTEAMIGLDIAPAGLAFGLCAFGALCLVTLLGHIAGRRRPLAAASWSRSSLCTSLSVCHALSWPGTTRTRADTCTSPRSSSSSPSPIF